MTKPPPSAGPSPDRAANQAAIRADVAIVGAGLVGGTLACALGRFGIKTAIIDRVNPAAMVATGFDGRASAVALSARRMLDAIGLWEHVAAFEPIREIRVSDGLSPFFLHYDHADLGSDPLGFMAENRHLRMAIAATMAKLAATNDTLTIISPAGVAGMTQTADDITLTLDDGRTVTAKLAVSAEGRGAKLREMANIPVTGWTYPQVAIVATIGHARPHDGVAHEHFLPAGPFAILPLPDDEKGVHRSSLVWTERGEAAAGYLALPEDAFLAEIAERVGGFLGALSLIGPRFSHPLGLQFAARYGAGRLVLAGDAAHGIHPIAGQGLNLGFRDVAALTEIITDARDLGLDLAHPEGMARYQRWRRADNLLMAGVTDVLNRLFSNDIAPVRLIRDLGLGAVNRIPPLKKLLMRHAMGTVGDVPRLMRGA
jgi:2-octaprenyl-6-methoxyphenol hydroxylase